MKALSKSQCQEKAELIVRLRDKHRKLDEVICAYNSEMAESQMEIEEALVELNGKIGDVRGWLEEITQEQNAYYEDKSEKWQEGENGQYYDSWKDQYEGVGGTEPLEIEFPEPLDVPECALPDELENLPDEP